MSINIEKTDEFQKLYQLLTKLANNNKDPDKVISIDTDELLRSNKPLETIESIKQDPIKSETEIQKVEPTKQEPPKRVLVIDDFLPPKTNQESTSSTTFSPFPTIPIFKNIVDNTTKTSIASPSFPIVKKTEQKETTSSKASIQIGINVQSNNDNHSVSIKPKSNPLTFEVKNDKNESTATIQIDIQLGEKSLPFLEEEQEVEKQKDKEESVQTNQVIEEYRLDNKATDPMIFNHPICKACNKTFTQFRFLKNHFKKYPVCSEWIKTNQKDYPLIPKKGLHILLEKYLQKIINGDKPHQCKYCKTIFSSTSNHHTHYHNFIACNRMAILDFIKNIDMLYEIE